MSLVLYCTSNPSLSWGSDRIIASAFMESAVNTRTFTIGVPVKNASSTSVDLEFRVIFMGQFLTMRTHQFLLRSPAHKFNFPFTYRFQGNVKLVNGSDKFSLDNALEERRLPLEDKGMSVGTI